MIIEIDQTEFGRFPMAGITVSIINFHTLDGFPGAVFSFTLSYYPIVALLTSSSTATPTPPRRTTSRSTPSWRTCGATSSSACSIG